MTELLPCPFCGNEANINYIIEEWVVYCLNDNCLVDVQTIGHKDKKDANKAWNTRISNE